MNEQDRTALAKLEERFEGLSVTVAKIESAIGRAVSKLDELIRHNERIAQHDRELSAIKRDIKELSDRTSSNHDFITDLKGRLAIVAFLAMTITGVASAIVTSLLRSF